MTTYVRLLLYRNIDLKLRNKSHGPMHYKICVILGIMNLNTKAVICLLLIEIMS